MLNLNLKDYYYAASIVTGLFVILIINDNFKIKTNKFFDFAFFICILMIPEIKFAILLTLNMFAVCVCVCVCVCLFLYCETV